MTNSAGLRIANGEGRTTTLSYETAVAQMYALGHELAHMPVHKFDLAQIRVLLAALGHPERSFPSVLIAGTNGKGSTASMLASILQASGLKTGLYTSPHLVRINERIRLDGKPIDDDDFALLHDVVGRTAERLVGEGDLPWHPSFFEMLTAMAFEYFSRNRPDIVVLEVGMGGRLDATNVVEPRVSIITDISLDHQKFLGETITEIAREKAGIIRAGGAVVALPQLAEANDVIGNSILAAGARAINAVPYVPPVSPESGQYLDFKSKFCIGKGTAGVPSKPGFGLGWGGGALAVPPEVNIDVALAAEGWQPDLREPQNPVSGPRQRYPLDVLGSTITVDSPLIGRHQLRNAALAIAAAVELREQGFPQITASSIERGIRETHWPGRFQVVREPIGESREPKTEDRKPRAESPEYVFDVAHNPAGAWALRATLSSVYADRPITLVFGVLRDKAVAEMAEILFSMAERVIVTHANNPRSASPQEIRQAAARVATEIGEAESVAEALEQARKAAGAEGLVVITGSIYVVGEAMRTLGVRI